MRLPARNHRSQAIQLPRRLAGPCRGTSRS